MAGDRFTLDPGIRALLDDLGIPAARLLRRAQLPAGLFRGGPVALTTRSTSASGTPSTPKSRTELHKRFLEDRTGSSLDHRALLPDA
jgi:hypothetical protein